jgi:hypothetical protein
MNHNWKSIKVKIFGIPVPLLLVLFVWIIAAGFSLTQTWLNQDKWRTFDSRREYKTVEYPRFKIDYPATWKSKAYHGYYRGTHDVWAEFGSSSFLSNSGLRIYWQPMTNTTLTAVNLWGQEIITRYDGHNVSVLLEEHIGSSNYPAWIQTFQIHGGTTMTAVYIVDDQSGYVLLFNAKPYNTEAEETFKQILASFQILEAEE